MHKLYLIIVMGVSGCGKTTIASQLAQVFDYHFIEADDFHSEQAKMHMSSGQALTDEMRLPWIERIKRELEQKYKQGQNSVLSYSGLRRAHREALRNIFDNTVFLHLVAPYDLISQRLNTRSNHFMPSTLLDSQFDALEAEYKETDIINLDAQCSIEQLVQQAAQRFNAIVNQYEE